ncbi:STAS domain-containing protein [Streptomyces minutiscleroticus]|uniref:STAS domain-containing protein n=1 Tax=Streptomyces minutiscleroticus TaxID=68238 RepID=A0A918KFI6_9ACTN|nr:STAS domain-containing protein [Streptomyces minutiscleroticus]GGX60318.1 hypothetical protein GCM10010358_13590 [Streptomyces minutiscleroticus]
MSAATYTLRTVPDGPVTVVSATGEVDATNATAFSAHVTDLTGGRPAVLDLGDLLYLDSFGFATLRRLIAQHPVAIVLPAQHPLHKAVTLTRLPHHHTLREACTAARDEPTAD